MYKKIQEEFKQKIDFIKENSIFVRSGECLRCGKCCQVYDKPSKEGGTLRFCNSFHYDKNNIGVCERQGINKPQICIDCPIYPHECTAPYCIDTCGYSFEINKELSKQEALAMFNAICEGCDRYPCDFHHETIKNIEELLH